MKSGLPRKERVTWTHDEEEALLQLYARARRDPILRGENGLRMKGWRWLAGEITMRYDSAKTKPVIQSKFARLMREYKLYLWLLKHSSLTQNGDGTVDMDEAEWQRIYAQRRADVSVLRRFRQQRGFPLAGLCAAANAEDGPFEPVPNASAHDHDEDDEDEDGEGLHSASDAAPAPAAPVTGVKRGRPSNSPSRVEAQRPRLSRDLPPVYGSESGRLFSPELERKLARCLDVVTAYFEASTAVLTQMGTSNDHGSDRRLNEL